MTNIIKAIRNFFTENRGVDSMRVTISQLGSGKFGLLDYTGNLAIDTTYTRARDARRGATRHGFTVAN